jgi:predicted dehydrogenase
MAIRVGLIGLNYGARVHLPVFADSGRYELVAVCARTPGRAESVARENKIPRWYTDARDLIASDLDLVSIATPTVNHSGLAAAALMAGKHVLVEVAFAGLTADARILAEMARRQGRIGAVAYALPYVPTLRLVSDKLAEGVIGQPRLLRMDYFSSFTPFSTREHRWFWEAENGGGLLAGFVSYGLDLARRWFGPVREVEATLAALTPVPPLPPGISPADDTGVVTLHFESGMLATYSYSAATALRRNQIELHGTEASFLVETYGEELQLLAMDADRPRRVYTPAEYLEDTRGQNGLLGGFQAFVERLSGPLRGEPVPLDLPTFDWTIDVVRLCEAARLASRERRRVRLDEMA